MTRRRPASYSASVRRYPLRSSQRPVARSRLTALTARSTMSGAIRANPDVARRAVSSSTRSGWAQNDPIVQSGVSARIGTGSIAASPPSQSASSVGAGEDTAVELGDLREVVAHQPHLAGDRRIEGEDHDRTPRDAPQLTDPPFAVEVPVVDGEDGGGGVHRVVAQRQLLRARPDRRREVGGSLRGHHVTRLDRDDVAVARFVGPGARADVHDRACVAEGSVDAGAHTRILAPGLGVAGSDRVVANRGARLVGAVGVQRARAHRDTVPAGRDGCEAWERAFVPALGRRCVRRREAGRSTAGQRIARSRRRTS